MPKTLLITINLGPTNVGLDLCGQVIKSDGSNMTSLIYSGFYEVGNGYYAWEYSNFPENFQGGVKFYNQSDTSSVVYFTNVNTENNLFCSEQETLEISSTFEISYSDQKNLDFYAILFSANDLSKAWNPSSKVFETYTLDNHNVFCLSLLQDTNRLGWYSYAISDTSNIPQVLGNQYYFIEVWKKIDTIPDRLSDINTGNLKVLWGKQNNNWLEIAKSVWEYGSRSLTDFPEIPSTLTPQQIWEYATRTLTSDVGCDFAELEKNILNAITISTGKTIEEISAMNEELGTSINNTFELLKTCCSSKVTGTPNIESPKIGARGSKSKDSDIKFSK